MNATKIELAHNLFFSLRTIFLSSFCLLLVSTFFVLKFTNYILPLLFLKVRKYIIIIVNDKYPADIFHYKLLLNLYGYYKQISFIL